MLLLLLCDCGSLALLELLSTVPPMATDGTATTDALEKQVIVNSWLKVPWMDLDDCV